MIYRGLCHLKAATSRLTPAILKGPATLFVALSLLLILFQHSEYIVCVFILTPKVLGSCLQKFHHLVALLFASSTLLQGPALSKDTSDFYTLYCIIATSIIITVIVVDGSVGDASLCATFPKTSLYLIILVSHFLPIFPEHLITKLLHHFSSLALHRARIPPEYPSPAGCVFLASTWSKAVTSSFATISNSIKYFPRS